MITISIEIHFTTLYMADLGTRAEPLGEGAAPLVFHLNTNCNHSQLKPLRRREKRIYVRKYMEMAGKMSVKIIGEKRLKGVHEYTIHNLLKRNVLFRINFDSSSVL
jgi:hypothetical protein